MQNFEETAAYGPRWEGLPACPVPLAIVRNLSSSKYHLKHFPDPHKVQQRPGFVNRAHENSSSDHCKGAPGQGTWRDGETMSNSPEQRAAPNQTGERRPCCWVQFLHTQRRLHADRRGNARHVDTPGTRCVMDSSFAFKMPRMILRVRRTQVVAAWHWL